MLLTSTSTSSPRLTVSSPSSMNSSMGTMPSDLKPKSMTTAALGDADDRAAHDRAFLKGRLLLLVLVEHRAEVEGVAAAAASARRRRHRRGRGGFRLCGRLLRGRGRGLGRRCGRLFGRGARCRRGLFRRGRGHGGVGRRVAAVSPASTEEAPAVGCSLVLSPLVGLSFSVDMELLSDSCWINLARPSGSLSRLPGGTTVRAQDRGAARERALKFCLE